MRSVSGQFTVRDLSISYRVVCRHQFPCQAAVSRRIDASRILHIAVIGVRAISGKEVIEVDSRAIRGLVAFQAEAVGDQLTLCTTGNVVGICNRTVGRQFSLHILVQNPVLPLTIIHLEIG